MNRVMYGAHVNVESPRAASAAPSTDTLWEALGELLSEAGRMTPPTDPTLEEDGMDGVDPAAPSAGLGAAPTTSQPRVHVNRRGSVEIAFPARISTTPAAAPVALPSKRRAPPPPPPMPVMSSEAYALRQLRQAVLTEQVAELRTQRLRAIAKARGIQWVGELDTRMDLVTS